MTGQDWDKRYCINCKAYRARDGWVKVLIKGSSRQRFVLRCSVCVARSKAKSCS